MSALARSPCQPLSPERETVASCAFLSPVKRSFSEQSFLSPQRLRLRTPRASQPDGREEAVAMLVKAATEPVATPIVAHSQRSVSEAANILVNRRAMAPQLASAKERMLDLTSLQTRREVFAYGKSAQPRPSPSMPPSQRREPTTPNRFGSSSSRIMGLPAGTQASSRMRSMTSTGSPQKRPGSSGGARIHQNHDDHRNFRLVPMLDPPSFLGGAALIKQGHFLEELERKGMFRIASRPSFKEAFRGITQHTTAGYKSLRISLRSS